MSNVQLQTSVMWSRKPGIWAKACDGLGGIGGGRSLLPPYSECSHTQAETERGNTLIGYVIGISMPDAEI